jgi:hypothetical protein
MNLKAHINEMNFKNKNLVFFYLNKLLKEVNLTSQ